MTINPSGASEAARRRADLAEGLCEAAGLREILNIPGGAGIQEILTHQLRVAAGLDHEQKLAWLEQVAAEWGTRTFPDGMGGRRAEQRFGAVRLTASVSHPDSSVSGYLARAAARRAANAGSPAAA